MSTKDLVAQEVQRLPELQAQAVLKFIRELAEAPALTAAELMRLPPAERRRILSNQARQAESVYRQDPEMSIDDTEAPASYV